MNGKPIAGSRTTTMLQTIHTAKERKSEGIEIHRFRVATALPHVAQNPRSSGVHSVRTRPGAGATPVRARFQTTTWNGRQR